LVGLLLLPVMLDVGYRSLRRVVCCMMRVALRDVGVVRGLLVVAALVMFGGFLVGVLPY
jgi:hypothetical protein